MSIPGNANTLLLNSAAAAAAGDPRSLRFNSADSAYLSRTPASAGNRKTWTWAGWVKRSASSRGLFEAGTTSNITSFAFGTADVLAIQNYEIGVVNLTWTTSSVFRDFSAWYHIVVSFDSTQTSDTDIVKIYVNGVSQSTTFSTNGSPGSMVGVDSFVNSTSQHRFSTYNGVQNYGNMYLADVHFIDGQALDPTSFGEFDDNGIWQPIDASGLTYGTNGFKLDFADNSSNTATTLGKDTSGNGNNWTPNNLSVTAGAGNDSLVDVPTNGSQTDTGVGNQVRGSYCTLNPLNTDSQSRLSNGNLDYAGPTTAGIRSQSHGTFGVSSGKWYFEMLMVSTDWIVLGVVPSSYQAQSADVTTVPGYYSYVWDGRISDGTTVTSGWGASFTTNDVIGVAFDADNGTLEFFKNGVSQGVAFSGMPSNTYSPFISDGSVNGVGQATLNFGQRRFAYSAPSGYKSLCTANLPAPAITKPSSVFDVKLYTGNSSTQTISGLGFSPDLVWIKARSAATRHDVFDTVRGVQKYLQTQAVTSETTDNNALGAFLSDGFSLGADGPTNGSGVSLVAWCWDAGSSTATNTAGSVTTSVRANPSAGFSIVTYTGGGAGSTMGHGLGVTPSLIITKARSNSVLWSVSGNIGGLIYGTNKLVLNSTAGIAADTNEVTAANSTTFTGGGSTATSGSGTTYVAYCFAPVESFSSIGSYVGNGSTDGPFVYLGFRPRWVMYKNASASSNWTIVDSLRDPYNVTGNYLSANTSDAELADPPVFDFTSNGFKVRRNTTGTNGSGNTIFYVAFAESPFSLARAR